MSSAERPASGSRAAIAGLFTGYGVAGLFWGSFAASTPAIQQASGLDAGPFGLALGLMSLTALPVMRLWGRRIHSLGRLAIPICLFVFALGCVVLALAPRVAGIIVALAILGGASGALDISLNLRTSELEMSTGAALFNRTHALFPLAMLLASATAGYARGEGAPISAIFLIVALAFLAAAFLDLRTSIRVADAPSSEDRPRRALGRVLLILAMTAALAAFLEMSAQSWAAIFVERVQGTGPAIAGLAPAAFVLGLSLGRVAAHAVENSIRPRAVLRISSLLAVPAFAAIAFDVPVAGTLLACLVAGIGVGPVEPAVFRSTARTAEGADRGPALASVTAIAYLGYLLSPPVLGGVADAFGWSAMWGLAAFLALVIAARTPLL